MTGNADPTMDPGAAGERTLAWATRQKQAKGDQVNDDGFDPDPDDDIEGEPVVTDSISIPPWAFGGRDIRDRLIYVGAAPQGEWLYVRARPDPTTLLVRRPTRWDFFRSWLRAVRAYTYVWSLDRWDDLCRVIRWAIRWAGRIPSREENER